jgi:hypothetical protein
MKITMSLRQQAEILGINAGHLSRVFSGQRPWNEETKRPYESLVGNGFGNSHVQNVARDSKKIR